MSKYYENLGDMTPDKLIAGNNIGILTQSATIDKLAAAATLKRGTVLSKGSTSGKLFVLGETQTYETHQNFEGDGSTTEFTVTAKPAALNKVTVDGVVKTITTDYAYVAATGKITFTTAPADNKAVVAFYNATDSGTPHSILCNDTDVGSDIDVVAEVYVSGQFAKDALIVAENYTITDADIAYLRNGGIYIENIVG